MAKAKKKNRFFICILVTFIVIMMYRMILLHLIGSVGVAYFSVANEVFFAFGFALCLGLEQAVGLLIESRMAKFMYNNADRILQAGFLLALLVGGVIGAVLFLLSKRYTGNWLSMPEAYLCLVAILPALPFLLIIGLLRGFFCGVSHRYVSVQSHYVFSLLYCILGLVFSKSFMDYGNKVSALLRVEDFKYSYGALGASVGIVAASFCCMLYMLVLFFIFRSRNRHEKQKRYQNTEETLGESVINVFLSAMGPFICYGTFFFKTLLNELIIFKNNDEGANAIEFSFGEYYGKTFPICGILVCILGMLSYSYLKKSIGALYRDENKNARDRLSKMIHRCSTLGFFVSAMIMVLAENILGLLYENNGQNTVKYLVFEGAAVVFGVFTLVMAHILRELRYVNLIALICGITFILDALLTYVLGYVANMSIIGIIIADIVLLAVVAGVSFIMVSKCFQYTQEWFRAFLVSIVGSIICALIGMLINNALLKVAGELVSLFISLIISVVMYIVALLALRGYSEDELESSALGRTVMYIGHILRLI